MGTVDIKVSSALFICRINNCIGELNQKYFIQFLFYTGKLWDVGLGPIAKGLALQLWVLAHCSPHTRPDQRLCSGVGVGCVVGTDRRRWHRKPHPDVSVG